MSTSEESGSADDEEEGSFRSVKVNPEFSMVSTSTTDISTPTEVPLRFMPPNEDRGSSYCSADEEREFGDELGDELDEESYDEDDSLYSYESDHIIRAHLGKDSCAPRKATTQECEVCAGSKKKSGPSTFQSHAVSFPTDVVLPITKVKGIVSKKKDKICPVKKKVIGHIGITKDSKKEEKDLCYSCEMRERPGSPCRQAPSARKRGGIVVLSKTINCSLCKK